MGKAEVIAANEIYEVAQRRAKAELEKIKNETDSRVGEARATGILQKIAYDEAHNKMIKYATLYQIKQSKSYKKGGMTWEEFCSSIGESRRTVDEIIEEIKPVYDEFSAKLADLINMPFNKIRYLGRAKLAESANFENGCLIFDGQKIQISPENMDEIEAAIDAMKESQKTETDKLKSKIEKLSNNVKKVVQEETKSLVVERNALIEQNKRLMAFDPAEKDHTWSVDQMKIIHETMLEFCGACRRMKMDERIADDMHIQGQVEGLMQTVEKTFRMLRNEWDEKFALFEG